MTSPKFDLKKISVQDIQDLEKGIGVLRSFIVGMVDRGSQLADVVHQDYNLTKALQILENIEVGIKNVEDARAAIVGLIEAIGALEEAVSDG